MRVEAIPEGLIAQPIRIRRLEGGYRREVPMPVFYVPEFYPTVFYLVDLNQRRGALEQSREWPARIDRMAARYRVELGDWLRFDYMVNHRDQIERHLAKQEQRRRNRG